MKLSLFYELQVPRPWEPESDRRLFADALEQIELADRLGFHTLWVVEHHFLEEYAHLSAPEVFLGAVSQRTTTLRLGHGIMNVLPAVNHPIRVAERAATLDVISGGRVELGTGESSSQAELGGFAVDIERKRDMWREGLEVAISSMADTPFPGVNGEFVQAPPRNVIPKPLQRPHPPLWMACSRRNTIPIAARNGLGVLCFYFIEPEACAAWVEEYYSVFENECVPIGRVPNPRIAMTTFSMCAESRATAQERVSEGLDFFSYASGHYYQAGEHVPGQTNLWEQFEQAQSEQGNGVGGRSKVAGASAVGTTNDVAAYLRRFEQAGVDEVLIGVQAGKIEHAHILETIERLGRDVLPEFAERDEAGTAERKRRVQRLVDAAMVRRPGTEDEAPPDYSFGVADTGMKAALDSTTDVWRGTEREERPSDASTPRGGTP